MAADALVRAARAEDAAALAELAARTFTEAFGAHNRPEDLADYVASSFDPARIAHEIADPSASTLVAEAGAELVGYAQLRRSDAPRAVTGPAPIELVRIYVLANRLGQGTGPALMERCLAEAHRMGAETLWLGVWGRNPRAIAFYTKWGFRPVGDHVFLLGSDEQTDLVMELDLSDIGRYERAGG